MIPSSINGRGRRATLKDVAELAGTSVATASRVLSGAGQASEETSRRVLGAAASLNYQPNLQARALRQHASRSVGLILPSLGNAYYAALADSISQILAGRNYHLLLSPTCDDPEAERDTLRDMVGQSVAGLMVVPCAMDAQTVAYLCEQDVPTVAMVRRVPGDGLDTVVFEDFDGARTATRYLLSLGHRVIGYIGGDLCYSSNQARRLGYLAGMHEAGLAADESLIKVGVLQSTWGALAALDLLRASPPPTALFVASNILASGVLRTLQSQRVAVPGDISLVCFDDVDWFSLTVPTITAVSSSHSKLADAAAALLLNRIENPDQRRRPPVLLEVGYEMVLRNSTAAPRRDVSTFERSNVRTFER
jgi:LacI family transcriptional regulator